MRTIKRYANRKLYDTSLRRYVNLVEISALVQKGTEVRVVDSRTGDDITKVTLSQILLDKEKRKQGLVPKTMFTNLIRKGSSSVIDYIKKGVESGRGLVDWFEKEVDKGVKKVVRAGQITETEGRRLREDLVDRILKSKSELESVVDNQVHSVLGRLSIPTQRDISRLTKKLDNLAARVESLSKSSTPRPKAKAKVEKKAATKRTAPAPKKKATAAKKSSRSSSAGRGTGGAKPIKVQTVQVQSPASMEAPAPDHV